MWDPNLKGQDETHYENHGLDLKWSHGDFDWYWLRTLRFIFHYRRLRCGRCFVCSWNLPAWKWKDVREQTFPDIVWQIKCHSNLPFRCILFFFIARGIIDIWTYITTKNAKSFVTSWSWIPVEPNCKKVFSCSIYLSSSHCFVKVSKARMSGMNWHIPIQ